MKSVLSFLGFIGGIFLYLTARSTRAQFFEAPKYTYQNITFDMANRGSYNSSDCLTDLINCWESVKPDMICFWWDYFASICSVVREFCAESFGDQDSYSKKWNLVEGMCYYNSWQKWT